MSDAADRLRKVNDEIVESDGGECEYTALIRQVLDENELLRDVERGAKQQIEDMEGEIERLRALLQRLVTDYQDVPDPTDADGQAVFEDARRALEGGK